MKELNISDTIKLPVDAVTQKLAFLGTTGSGKSFAATKLAEEMHAAGAQIVALDPVGIWYGLRSAADGKSPGIAIPVFGGLHGDVPLEPTGGALLADLIVDKHLSCVIDVSQFEHDTHKSKFAADFGLRLFFRKKSSPSAMHLFIEECEEFLPQEPERGEERMIHEFKRIWKLGRNFGIGGSLISQRPQEVLKKALNLSECLFAFQTNGSHERAAIDKWISDKKLQQDIAADLPKLAKGHCHLWSPSWLKVTETIKISTKWTFDASRTPKVGEAPKAAKMSEINLAQIAEQMQATIEKAKAEDPKELQRIIASQKKEISVLQQSKPTNTETIKEVPALTPEDRKLIERATEAYECLNNDVCEFNSKAQHMVDPLNRLRSLVEGKLLVPQAARLAAKPVAILSRRALVATRQAPPSSDSVDFRLGRCERSILAALAQYPKGRTAIQVAILSGYSSGSGGFNNSLSGLRSADFITRGNPIQITEDGLNALGSYDPLPTGEALAAHWISKLARCEACILKSLLDVYPNYSTTAEVAEKTGYQASSGGFNKSLSKLRTLELITRGQPMKASDDFSQ